MIVHSARQVKTMSEKQDIFKLVEEIEREKKQSSIDDIYSALDSIKDEDVEIKESKNSSSDFVENTPHQSTNSGIVSKPSLPNSIGEFDTRFECFSSLIEHVSYGTVNSGEYVSGHKDALEKYFKEAYSNQKDLYVVLAKVNDEIKKFKSKENLYSKGYYDGLYYVYLSLKRSKELMVEKIADIMGKKL